MCLIILKDNNIKKKKERRSMQYKKTVFDLIEEQDWYSLTGLSKECELYLLKLILIYCYHGHGIDNESNFFRTVFSEHWKLSSIIFPLVKYCNLKQASTHYEQTKVQPNEQMKVQPSEQMKVQPSEQVKVHPNEQMKAHPKGQNALQKQFENGTPLQQFIFLTEEYTRYYNKKSSFGQCVSFLFADIWPNDNGTSSCTFVSRYKVLIVNFTLLMLYMPRFKLPASFIMDLILQIFDAQSIIYYLFFFFYAFVYAINTNSLFFFFFFFFKKKKKKKKKTSYVKKYCELRLNRLQNCRGILHKCFKAIYVVAL
ncbi:hypothetical protein RFI_15524 [Reticulomyxa filosa]|uniref:Uncharacterized protein n=1 Tax=Reticulomyxa filosa TaxID=46433 RepID=X6N7E4_RETFI|nr:hypothetical protein RFI_15524 [Reticulomyxa filosa]|eukprot:ETO21679.1 hypothetical protein RFI_15524 [Reticulomyxa filosa]